MSSNNEQELKEEIVELRAELGETVQALVHKADVPTRAKQRGNELKEQAIERGSELGYQVLERGNELRDQVVYRSNQWKDQAVDAAERAREAVSQRSRERWATLVGAGLMLVALTVIARRVRTR
ncbi:MAG: DUF3618 domain-containing protein [Pseudonocardiaceae bacterium]